MTKARQILSQGRMLIAANAREPGKGDRIERLDAISAQGPHHCHCLSFPH